MDSISYISDPSVGDYTILILNISDPSVGDYTILILNISDPSVWDYTILILNIPHTILLLHLREEHKKKHIMYTYTQAAIWKVAKICKTMGRL